MTEKTSTPIFYVVTRNQRRIEERNYQNISDAEIRAEQLRDVLKKWDPNQVSRVSIETTKTPYKIK